MKKNKIIIGVKGTDGKPASAGSCYINSSDPSVAIVDFHNVKDINGPANYNNVEKKAHTSIRIHGAKSLRVFIEELTNLHKHMEGVDTPTRADMGDTISKALMERFGLDATATAMTPGELIKHLRTHEREKLGRPTRGTTEAHLLNMVKEINKSMALLLSLLRESTPPSDKPETKKKEEKAEPAH